MIRTLRMLVVVSVICVFCSLRLHADSEKNGETGGKAGPDKALTESQVTYRDGEVTLRGTLIYDPDHVGSRPGVLVLPEWWGITDYPKQRARQLAELGYIAFVADMYGDARVTNDPKAAGEWSKAFYTDRALFRSRAAAALATLAKQPLTKQQSVDGRRMAAIGYCFGGTAVLELARSGAPLAGAVSFHGNLSNPTPSDSKSIKTPLLILNGEADSFVPAEDRAAFRREMNDAGVTYTFIDYSGALHSFTNPDADKLSLKGVAYNRRADLQSWQHMELFLRDVFNKS